MRIGVMSSLLHDERMTFEQVVADITDAEARGFAFYALPNVLSDTLYNNKTYLCIDCTLIILEASFGSTFHSLSL